MGQDGLGRGDLAALVVEEGGLPTPSAFAAGGGNPILHHLPGRPGRMHARHRTPRFRQWGSEEIPEGPVPIENPAFGICEAHEIRGGLQDPGEPVLKGAPLRFREGHPGDSWPI